MCKHLCDDSKSRRLWRPCRLPRPSVEEKPAEIKDSRIQGRHWATASVHTAILTLDQMLIRRVLLITPKMILREEVAPRDKSGPVQD